MYCYICYLIFSKRAIRREYLALDSSEDVVLVFVARISMFDLWSNKRIAVASSFFERKFLETTTSLLCSSSLITKRYCNGINGGCFEIVTDFRNAFASSVVVVFMTVDSFSVFDFFLNE